MKKTIIALMIMLLTFTCFAKSEPTYATAGELYQSWGGNYPDYICGVWSSDGGMTNLTFAVLDNEAGEAGKQAILDMLEDDSTVTFVYQKVSRNHLSMVQEELLPYFEKKLGLVWAALDETENEIDLGILEERRDDPETIAMLEELKSKFGDIFEVEYSKQPVNTLDLELPNVAVTFVEEPQSNSWYYLAFSALLLAATAVFVLVAKKKGLLVKQTNVGTVTESAPLSVSEVESMVKDSHISVPQELDTKIMSDIEKK